jgi:hypothetical protein
MKKILHTTMLLLAISGQSQENAAWRIGLQWGFHANSSSPVKGNDMANARFHHNKFGGGSLSLQARYDFHRHWMMMLGLGIESFGFDFALSQNYRIGNENKHYAGLKPEFTAFEIPVMFYYKFNPDCKNKRWLIGAGLIKTLTGIQKSSGRFTEGDEGNANASYMSYNAQTLNPGLMMLRLAVNREKKFRNGTILSAGLVCNFGLKQLARAEVTYSVDGNEYHHEFVNRGNFAGLRIAYFFRPLSPE